MTRRFRIIIAAGFVLGFLVPAQPFARTQNFKFRHLSIDQGLSQGLVTCVLQDQKGFMWLGTKDGLNRYDGYEFVYFSHEPYDSTTLSNSTISCLYESADGFLWVGTVDGLNRFSRRSNEFVRFFHDPADTFSIRNDTVNCLESSGDGEMWVGTSAGLDRYEAASGRFYRVEYERGARPVEGSEAVVSVLTDDSGLSWVGTADGLYSRDDATGRLSRYTQQGGAQELVRGRINCMFVDKSDRLWIGSGNDVARYDPAAERFEVEELTLGPDSLESQTILSMAQDLDGRMWMAYLGYPGVFVWDPDRREGVSLYPEAFDEEGLSTGSVRCIYRDAYDGMWVGTNGYGADYWSPYVRKFFLYRHPAFDVDKPAVNSVRAIHEDVDGKIWIGGYGNLSRLDRDTGQWWRITSDESDPDRRVGNVYTICDDPPSRGAYLWIGTEGLGIAKFDRETLLFTKYPYGGIGTDGLTGGEVLAACTDSSGIMWLGTELGLNRFDPVDEEFTYIDVSGGANTGVCALLFARTGFLWLGRINGGLTRYDRYTGETVTYKHDSSDSLSLSHDHVLSILEGLDGTMWIGTHGGGLNRFDATAGVFKHFLVPDGLPNNVVYGILEDDGGNLWLSTNKGISRFNPVTEEFYNFHVQDGLQSNEFNTAAYYKSRSGEMFFGGIKGFNSFRPEDVTLDPHGPAVAITGLQIGNHQVPIGKFADGRRILEKAITETEALRLAYYDDVVSFSFAAMHYALPERNTYAYKLEGLDRTWHNIGERHFVTFTDLRPGRYVLRVKAANSDGIWNEAGTSIAIKVVPPWWGTVWFRIVALLCLLSLLLIAHRLRTFYIRKRNRELDAMNAQLLDHIQKRARAERELRESEEKYRVVAQSASEGIMTVDEYGKIMLVNQSLEMIFGYSSDELIGQSVSRLMPSFPGHVRSFHDGERPGAVGESIPLIGINKRGEERLLETSIGEFRAEKRRMVVALIRDVTERKKLEEQFLQAQKMDAVGRLAGGIAHDLNNLLTVIQGHGELVHHILPERAPARDDVEEILGASKRAESLTRQLLAFSRKQMLIPQVLNVNDLVEEMGRMLDRAVGETIEIELKLAPSLGNVKADRGQIEQVIMNLVVNARDAMPDGGKITIETRNLDAGGEETRLREDLAGDSYVLIIISDNGVGMEPETQAKIFEPFFTTKSTGEGTGLGLSTVYGIVKQSGGSVWVDSRLGEGSSFSVCLPRVDASKTTPAPAPAQPDIPEGAGTILVVEDEEGVRRLIADVLRRKGYEVLEAGDGGVAIDIFERHGSDIDIILTDAVMPGVGGQEFVRKIADRLGNTKVLFMSGYAVDMLDKDGGVDSETSFIHKPFTPVELLGRIQRMLTTDHPAKPR